MYEVELSKGDLEGAWHDLCAASRAQPSRTALRAVQNAIGQEYGAKWDALPDTHTLSAPVQAAYRGLVDTLRSPGNR